MTTFPPQWTGSFEIHWVRQYLINFTGLVGIINTTVYNTELIFIGLGHWKLSNFCIAFSYRSSFLSFWWRSFIPVWSLAARSNSPYLCASWWACSCTDSPSLCSLRRASRSPWAGYVHTSSTAASLTRHSWTAHMGSEYDVMVLKWRVTCGPPSERANMELWYISCWHEQAVEQTAELSMI